MDMETDKIKVQTKMQPYDGSPICSPWFTHTHNKIKMQNLFSVFNEIKWTEQNK